ncbi:MAG: hypothetical protein KDC44_12915, partial [Phaeodactylibacter sp.]|nr:hypothetical protein [Phaeodactylibacter sp.]
MQRFLFTPLLFMATWLAAHPVEITTVDTCNFDLLIQLEPSVPGNTYCPGDVVILSVQSGLDAYNWYYNYTGDPDDNQLIASDVNVIAIDISFFGFGYFSVEATDDGCTELSDPVLIDSYAFLLPVIASDGTTEFCAGDSTTIWYPSPGGAFFQWELNGNPIPGATDSVYQVTQPGTYTLSMSYEVCPNNFFNSGVGPTFSTLTPIPTEIIVDPGLGISGLSASTGTVVQWYLNELPIPGATQPTYVADTDGLYQVEVIDAQGCTVFSPP